MTAGVYISDDKVLRKANRANRLYTAAQNSLGEALEFTYLMAQSYPERNFRVGPWVLSYILAARAADIASEKQTVFKRIVGDVDVHARREDIERIRAKLGERGIAESVSAPRIDADPLNSIFFS